MRLSEVAEIDRLDALSTVADSHRAWLDYGSEYLRRGSERHPALMADFQSHCTMHKDNMYSIRDSGTGP